MVSIMEFVSSNFEQAFLNYPTYRAGRAPVVLVWCLCALLLVAAFACKSNDSVGPPRGETPVPNVDVTLPRHHEPPVVNSGDGAVLSPQDEIPMANDAVALPRHHEPPVINSGQDENPMANDAVALPRHHEPPVINSGQDENPMANDRVALPRHHEPPVINSGDQYVFGELFQSGNCLRVTYRDQVSPELTREGLLVVWPPGFSAVVQDDVAHVADSDGRILATTGDTVRLSGRKARHSVGEAPEWDWDGEPGAGCGGTHWLVGDEVSAGVSQSSSADTDAEIFFPTLGHQRGPIVSMAALLEGRLELEEGCLRVVPEGDPRGFVVVWPPGFEVQWQREVIAVANGGGSVIAKVGDDVALGGGQPPNSVFPEGSRCPGEVWHAMEVHRMP